MPPCMSKGDINQGVLLSDPTLLSSSSIHTVLSVLDTVIEVERAGRTEFQLFKALRCLC